MGLQGVWFSSELSLPQDVCYIMPVSTKLFAMRNDSLNIHEGVSYSSVLFEIQTIRINLMAVKVSSLFEMVRCVTW